WIMTNAHAQYLEMKKSGNTMGLTLEDIQQRLLNRKLDEAYRGELRRAMTLDGLAGDVHRVAAQMGEDVTPTILESDVMAVDTPSLLLYNEYFKEKPSDWYNPASWGAENWDEFEDGCVDFAFETVMTAGIGAGAGAAGEKVGQGVLKSLARRGFSKAAIEAVEKGGIKVLREALQKEGTQVLKAFLMKQGASIAAEGATLFALGTMQSFLMNPEAAVKSFSSIGGGVDQLFESIAKAAVYRVIGAGGARIMGRNPTVARILMQEVVSGAGGAAVEAAGLAMKGEKQQITGKWLAYSLIQNAFQSGFMGVGRKMVEPLTARPDKGTAAYERETTSQQLLENFSLSDAGRAEKTTEVIGRELTEAQKKALIDAHNVGDERVRAKLAEKGKKLSDLSLEELQSLYKIGELKAKYKILLEAGYSKKEAAKILREGVAGGVASEQTAKGAKGKEGSWLSRIFGSGTKKIDSMNAKAFPRGTEIFIGQPPKRYEVSGFEKGKIKLRAAAHEMAIYMTADELRKMGGESKALAKEAAVPSPAPEAPRLPQSFSETPGFRAGEQINLPGSKFNGLYVASEMPDGSVMLSHNKPVAGNTLMLKRTSWSEILYGAKVKDGYVTRIVEDKAMVWHLDPKNPAYRGYTRMEESVPLAEVLSQLSGQPSSAAPAPERANQIPDLKNEITRKVAELPDSFDLMAGDKVYKYSVESVDYATGMVKIRLHHGHAIYEVHINDLLGEIKDRHVPQNEVQPVAPTYAPEVGEGMVERNDVRRPPEQVPRSSDVLSVGDLHGNYNILVDNLKSLGAIPESGEMHWIGGNKKIVFHGDILADRNTRGLEILDAIGQLQAQAAKEGGGVTLIAGNHEDFAISFLTGKEVAGGGDAFSWCFTGGEQGKGIIEFMRFASDPKLHSVESMLGILSVLPDASAQTMQGLQQDIVHNMRNNPEGKKYLEQMASMKLVDYIGDSLFIHTELTPEILATLSDNGSTVGQSIDSINARYQQGLRFLLLGEGSMPADFHQLSDIFTYTDNRSFNANLGDLQWLNDHGVNHVIYGHSHKKIGQNVNMTPDGVMLIGVDHSAGKRGNGLQEGENPSVGRIAKNGQFVNQ
ncbi:metallophosphoesterase, partial [Patescibacteria group bacterium]|nr:metallophosphoesterase [Patescibacteria group bacterium]